MPAEKTLFLKEVLDLFRKSRKCLGSFRENVCCSVCFEGNLRQKFSETRCTNTCSNSARKTLMFSNAFIVHFKQLFV